eukprot:8736944-Heterocapsa_arctica.AAC.1
MKEEFSRLRRFIRDNYKGADEEEAEDAKPPVPTGAWRHDMTPEQKHKVRTWLEEEKHMGAMAKVVEPEHFNMQE